LPSTAFRRLSALAGHVSASGAAGRRHEPLTGFVWVTLAMVCFAGLGGFAKYAIQQGLDPLQVIFFRNVFCLLLMLPLLYWRGPSLVRSRQIRLYGVRVGLAFVSMMCWFQALALIPYADLTAMTFLAPLFATLFAVLWLGEVVGIRRWTALVVGFLGAMIILRPSASGFGAGQLLALVSTLVNGVIGPLLKHMTAEDDADRIVFLSNLIMSPLSLVPALFVWVWPPLALWPVLFGMGLAAVIGHVALLRGFATTDASLVFTFEFSRLPFVVLIGTIVFGEVTDAWTWIGALVIFASAAYVTRREVELSRSGGLVRARDPIDPLSLTPLRLER
jgi:drug/metabolite transporter (DMT)-like permease